MPEPSLRIHLFGTCEVTWLSKPLPPLPRRKGVYLIALLALRLGRDVPRPWIAETLWPDSEPDKALRNLRQILHDHLRPALGEAVTCLLSPTPGTLSLDASTVWVDALAFDCLLTRPAVGVTPPAALEQAVKLYRGPLLEGCEEEWCLPERIAREQAYLAALDALASSAMRRSEPRAAVRWLQLALATDPLREDIHRNLMQALADGGDYGAVTGVYRDLRLRLHRHLHATVAPETEALYAHLQRRSHIPVTLPRCPSAPVSLPPARLPVPLTRLIGRQAAVEEVAGWLGIGRLVTLTGAGGVGKTRLAIAVGEALQASFADGVWFVDIAPLREPERVGPTVARTLGVRESSGRTAEEALSKALASRSLLVLLDNCEHLLTACAALTEELLRSCSGLRVLATSRSSLGLVGERIYRTPSLDLPPASGAILDKNTDFVLEYSAVALFVERALLVQPGFRLTYENVRSAARLCYRLDGIPLALELAAARLRSLSVNELEARLDDRFRLLTGGTGTSLPRHRTLRALIDWSYNLLNEQERLLLARLSVFAGGWSLEAAEVVCTDETLIDRTQALDLLAGLVDKSLVVAEMNEGVSRYQLLDTIRRYAADRLRENGDSAALRQRHLQFYLKFAQARLQEEAQSSLWDRWEQEHDNLRAALEWCRTVPQEVKTGMLLSVAMTGFWDARGYWQEGRECLESALEQDHGPPSLLRGQALRSAGWLTLLLEDYTSARRCLEECLMVSQALEDQSGIACALSDLGAVLRDQGEFSEARPYFEQSLALSRDIGDRLGIALGLHRVGIVDYFLGHLISARDLLKEALDIRRDMGAWHGAAWSLILLGRVFCDLGDYASAHTSYAESLVLQSEKLGERCDTAIDLIAILAVIMGQCRRAIRLFGAAHAIRAPQRIPVMKLDQERYHFYLAMVREQAGESAFAEAWAEGCAMPLERAIQLALSWREPPHS